MKRIEGNPQGWYLGSTRGYYSEFDDPTGFGVMHQSGQYRVPRFGDLKRQFWQDRHTFGKVGALLFLPEFSLDPFADGLDGIVNAHLIKRQRQGGQKELNGSFRTAIAIMEEINGKAPGNPKIIIVDLDQTIQYFFSRLLGYDILKTNKELGW